MPLYKINKNILKIVKEQKFRLEKDIQKFVEDNLQDLFGLEFIATERKISSLFIDTLAYDPENKSFVIIEYKRDSSFSVVDQGFSYLSLMLNNKADFILEFNEKRERPLRREDIDWSQSRVLFIAPSFTTHQINAVNFKNMPFELWQIRKYEDSLLSIESINNEGATEEAPDVLAGTKASKVAKEVRQYTEKEYFGSKKKSYDTYKELKERLVESYPELLFDVKKSSINVKHKDNWRVVVYINAYTDKLRFVFTRSKPSDFVDAQKKVVHDKKGMKYYNQELSHFDIKNNNQEDMEYVTDLFRQAYKRYKKEFIEN